MSATEGEEMDKDSVHLYDAGNEGRATEKKRREELCPGFLSHHPYPIWEVVIDLL